MQPLKIRAKKRRTVLALTLALGVGLPPPAQAYLLDFTAASINPGLFISYAGTSISRPPSVGNLNTGLSRMGGLGHQVNPAITLHNRITIFQTGPIAQYLSIVPSTDDGLPVYFDIPRQTTDDNFNPGSAVRFTSTAGASVGAMVPSGNILNHLAPFSSTLLLLGCGLMGLAGLRYRRRRG